MKIFFKHKYFIPALFIVAFIILIVFTSDVYAQCPMCKASVETNMKNNTGGNVIGAGLNNGILYLLAMPYILVGIIAFLWYKNTKKYQEAVK